MNLGPALATLPRRSITLLLSSGDTWDHGRLVRGGESDGATFRGVVQPLPEKKLHLLPEGEQAFGAKLIHAKYVLQTSDEATGVLADYVRIGTTRYKIAAVGDWSQFGFRRYVGVEEVWGR